MQEIEIRAVVDAAERTKIENKLKELGFVQKSKVVQHDIVFDKPNAELFKSGCKIRLRVEGDKKEITYKGTMLASAEVSRRSELNVPLGTDAKAADVCDFFVSIGYPMLFQVKKERVKYQKQGTMVTFDEWPIIGCMVELEGEESEILALAKELSSKYEFKNLRLKHFFQQKIETSGKTLDELISEYEKQTGFCLGNLALSLGL